MQKSKNNKYPSVTKVSDEERIGMVKEIFSTITGKYDFLNHFLSLRRDVAWRKFAVRKMVFSGTKKFLDIACGTGDLSINACRRHGDVSVTGIDFIYPMVQVAKEKARDQNLSDRIDFLQGNALHLPFAENTFDVTAMAFGIRNIPQKEQALKEMLRVTVPGGQIMILEMTFIQNRFFKLFYYIYLNFLLPLLAKIFSKNAAAYYYLADSIMNFPSPEAFAAFMKDKGISDVKIYPLTFGITCLYAGKKP
ncbi:MAG TPA: bifunctional demethylmenaquinone methyltransferase/2-methoxy-6-polyprenyl-1,4-benzoquinol methylase UbiE [Smithella sp.]|nr:bifunctional demethylmenaquinone methyltransferase/2-methoxy-6-polyprenyl-1,4-benzoquinol methylase UbiE [Smithella sp.]MDM7986014.1 bifunctional demethylmenaquinone methyltransferase/2-methoxy-6-polyprenyl-1,4-benzoquinol methylase UbiE [Smithella sp.]HNY51020.1 bifunctional demethylmenaquinone methyltransferase/2-methoxy-6-polyprenyl-1,4-benzoquinol methylase UbiE [Smithella sp.]HOG91128.1 bifunctional demethylmenaquinone methyltransferase/2-methoxy-6-polyprenyl-1,4-benzoquinol methylase Ub